MRIAVLPPGLGIGGSELAAVQLAAAMRDKGHTVVIVAPPGPLATRCHELGLPTIELPARRRPNRQSIAALRHLVAHERIDVVHAYEVSAVLDAYFGAHLLDDVPLVASILSTNVHRHLVPSSIPLVVGGRPALAAGLAARRRGAVHAVAPPIDVEEDHPGIEGRPFRTTHGLDDDEVLVIVSRLDGNEKLVGIGAAIGSVGRLTTSRRCRLVIVGDGPDRSRVEVMVANAPAGAVIVVGAMADPRAAYAAADVVIGRGSSVLRGMAHGRAAVVVDDRGGACVVDERSVCHFVRHGYLVPPDGPGSGDLIAILSGLLDDDERRAHLGTFGRLTVSAHRSPAALADALEQVYSDAVAAPARRGPAIAVEAALAAAMLARRNVLVRSARRPWGRALRRRFGTRPPGERTSDS